MDKVFKIAAYITSYEDQVALQKCVQCILMQSYPVSQIFIVDNSRVKINTIFSDPERITINHYPENIGISQGLTLALRWAIDFQYDFLWTFDQDSEALPTTLEHLLRSYLFLNQQNISVGIVSPKVIDLKSNNEIDGLKFNGYRFYRNLAKYEQFDKKNIYEYDVTITSGALINLALAKFIDPPDPRLFIDAVDFDYCMRFREKGYRIFIDKNSILNHNFGDYICHRSVFNSQVIPVYSYSTLRYYYMMRNHTWLELRLSKTFYFKVLCILYRFLKLVKTCIKILRYESSSKFLKIYASARGLIHGLVGSLGKF